MHHSIDVTRSLVMPLLCCGIAVTGLLIGQRTIVLAQDKAAKKAPSPDELFGKPFEQCEKILGKPARTINPQSENRAYARYYRAPGQGVTRIILERVPEGRMDGPVPKIVNSVTYHFPKGKVTWQGALALIGVSTNGVKANQNDTGHTMDLQAISGGYQAVWVPAEDSISMPPQYRHPNDDSLSFQKQ